MTKNTAVALSLTILLALAGCSKETFTGQTQSTSVTVNSTEVITSYSCANSTVLKPKVDFLFVIDNSSSATYYFPTDLKAAILNTLYKISDNYDYRVYFAPLLPTGTETSTITSYKILTSNQEYLTAALQSQVAVPSSLSFFTSQGNTANELGFKRVYELLTGNVASDQLGNNGIFRKQANTVVVMISSGDDTDYTVGTQGISYQQDISGWVQKFQQLTDKYYLGTSSAVPFPLRSKNLRFISLVAQSTCSGYKKGTRYMQMSNSLYNYAKGSSTNSIVDSFNLCSGNFSTIFDEVAKSIDVTIQPHVYNFWPVQKNTNSFSFDVNKITVSKIKADGTMVSVPSDATNGFTFDPSYHQDFNIRLLPAVSDLFPAENYSGFFIQLNGTATVQTPECLIVKTKMPQDFYGYYVISQEPDLAQTQIYKNGVLLAQSTSNGWSYEGYFPSLNIKVKSASDPTPVSSGGEFKTGYAIKFNGSAIFSNEDTIQVIFKAKAL